MLQKYYKILVHLNQPTHLRELARKTKLTPPLLARRLNELEQEKVVDYKTEGKNKIYHKRDTLEAKTYEKMLEHYKVLKLPLAELTETIQQDERIQLAILFGSYARGDYNKNSDIDLFIQGKDNLLREEYTRKFPKLHVILGDFKEESPLKEEIKKHHVIIKGIDKYYERK